MFFVLLPTRLPTASVSTNTSRVATLAETYPGKIESRYSIGWPTDEDKFFKGADSVIFFCTGGGRHLVLGHEEKFDKLMKTNLFPLRRGDHKRHWGTGYAQLDGRLLRDALVS